MTAWVRERTPELAQDHRDVRLHGGFADAQLVGDLLVLVALDHQREHAPLLRRELGGALGEGIGGWRFRRREDLAVQHRAHRAGDLVQRGRLVDIGRGAELIGAPHHGRLARRRHDDDRHGGMIRAQHGKAGQPIHARHVEIEQQRIGFRRAVQRRRGLGQGGRHVDMRAGEGLAERRRQGVAHHRMVVGDQERQRLAAMDRPLDRFPAAQWRATLHIVNRAFD